MIKAWFAYSQPLNKKLVKVSSAMHVFTSLNVKLFDWSQSVVLHVLKIIFEVFFPKVYNFSVSTARQKVCNLAAWRLVSQVSHETANQTGAMRGSCIRRLQTKLEANQIHQNLHTSQTRVGKPRTCSRDR